MFSAPVISNHAFNVQEANRTLDKLTIRLSVEQPTVQKLENAVRELTVLQSRAKVCVETSQKELGDTNKLWDEAKSGTEAKSDKDITPADLTSVQKYLKEKRDELTRRRSECRLFVLRSGEAISAFTEASKKLSTEQLLKVKANFWESLLTTTKITKKIYEQFNGKLFLDQSGIEKIHYGVLVLFLVFLLIAIVVGFWIKKSVSRRIRTKPMETFADKLEFAFVVMLGRYSWLLFVSLIFLVFASVSGMKAGHLTYLMLISYSLILYTLILMALHFFFYPFKEERSISSLSPKTAHLLVRRLKYLTTLCFFSLVVYILFYEQTLPVEAIDLARTIFITLFTINLISILWLINRLPKLLYKHTVMRVLISILLTCILLVILAAEWMGYQQLVSYVLKGMALTLVFGFLGWFIYRIFMNVLRGVAHDKQPWQEYIRSRLGMQQHESIPEILWLHVIIYVVVWGGFLLILLKIWGISESNYRAFVDMLIEGFKAADLMIVPSRIFSAFLFFVIMSLLIRWFKTFLEKRESIDVARGSKEALAAVVSYVGMAMVILISLLIAGVNFAGLAIIAGALSVGIGFGLQNIVNNFVSGIILLIERPIKPGDRILVGNTEGFVKRISIRSTQIQTLKLSELIVPNSEIISGQVTNLMFHDTYGRIGVSVGVAYGSDTELVKKILGQVAEENPDVITDTPKYQPLILFREFGDSSLKFEMYCVIRDVNKKFLVGSELNFAIDKLFRENHVVIAFPQRDIHIRDWIAKKEEVLATKS